MGQAAQAPSGTRDFLADELRRRKSAIAAVSDVFERYGFDPLETPAFERLDVVTGKYGEEAASLLFKILRRGVHETSGQADLALRYDHTVPLARVIGTHGSKLPSPFKRYAIGPVWRADRPQEGRFREFVQCDVDTVGSHSPLADAEIVYAVAHALEALGIADFRFLVNSREALRGLLEVYGVEAALGDGVLATLDKLDKVGTEAVVAELAERGVSAATAESMIADIAADSPDRIRAKLEANPRGKQGLAEVDRLLELTSGLQGRTAFAPRMVRGLDYYTGAIWEVEAAGYPGAVAAGGRYDRLVAALGGPDVPAVGGSVGIERILAMREPAPEDEPGLDVALTVLDGGEADLMRLAHELRRSGLRVGTYLGSSSKLARQLKWANDRNARLAVIRGAGEQAAGEMAVRDMASGEQQRVPDADAVAGIQRLLRG
ncbi:histidine--tRNA ligase [Streptomonospora wellingtoniae]|uniref:Histidine--tRNA ligase n=1 Tax=Streptomonospora wellingtoniae TaxID=3075544 RepID=A0ABU2KYD7_9ACTN|nr:histidine--tRNA ligase [Streptomonospora sp. DSM 45055]MDT0304325.1 histidine--tRNA ligase [Streptomonospora sp. DSM 45055]